MTVGKAQQPGQKVLPARTPPARTPPARVDAAVEPVPRTTGVNLLDLPVSAPQYLLVETTPRPHQLAKHAFLAELKQRVIAGAAEELAGTQWSAEQCPYLDYWFSYYETRSASAVEAALRKYLPGVGSLADASEFYDPAVARVRRAIATWAGTGELDVPPAAMPEAIAASVKLGLGQSLESATRSRFETAMGTDLSEVRVHADSPGAAVASSEDARAVTVGNHVAFAAGEYTPGTMHGDALLAHELAHTKQQVGPPSHGASAVHERAADRTATSIWSRLWGRVTGALPATQGAMPALRTGLQLQRCPATRRDDEPQQFALDEPPQDVVVYTNPNLDMDEPGRGHAHAVVGQKVDFSLNNKGAVVRNDDGGVLHAKSWAIYPPSAKEPTGRWNQVSKKNVEFYKAGRWLVFYEGIYGDTQPFMSGITVDVVSLDEAETRFIADRNASIEKRTKNKQHGPSLGWVPFRANVAFEEIKLAQRGLKVQHLSTKKTWIDSDNKNPAEPSSDPVHYTVKPSPGATTFEWYVSVDDPRSMPTESYYGHQRTTRDGEPVFEMSANGTTASFTFEDPGVFYVWCDQFDSAHRLVDRVRYIQSVQTTEQYKDGLGKWKTYITDVDKAHDKIKPGAGQQVDAVFVDQYTGRARDLNIFIGPEEGSSKYLLLDFTFGASRIEFEGDDLEDAVHTFDKKNKYPDGVIKIHVPKRTQPFSIATTGESDLSKASHRTGQVSMGLLGLGLLAAVIPFAEPAAPYLLGAAGLGGAASGTLSLVDRIQQTHVDVSGAALDVVGIAASMIGSAQALEQIVAKRAAKAAAGTAARGSAAGSAVRGSRFLLWAQFTTDAVGGLLISAEALDEINQINKRTGMSDGQRIDAIVRILSQLALQGGMLAISSKALAETQPKLRSALGEAAAAQLSGSPNAPALALLDENAVNGLRNIPTGELDQVAELVALDPVASESALATGKVKSAAELEQAIAEGKIGDTPLADVRTSEPQPPTPEAKVPEPTKPGEPPTKPVEPPAKPVEPAVKPVEKTAPPPAPQLDPGGRGEWAMDDAEIGDRLSTEEKADLRAKEAKTPETQQELEDLVKLREKARGGPPAEVQVGSPEHALERWKDYAGKPTPKYSFKRWMSGHSSRMSNPVRGLKREAAYRTKLAKWFKGVKSGFLNGPASAKPRQADAVFQRPGKKGLDILQIKVGEESLTRTPRRSGGKSAGSSSHSNFDALQIDAEFVANGDRVTWVHEELPSGNLVKEATDKGVGVIIRAEDQAAADRMRANMKRAKMTDAQIAKVEIIIEGDLVKFEDQVLARYEPPEPEPKP